MKNLRILASIIFMVSVFAMPMNSRAGIVLDFTGDTFFASNPVARAALEQAAADINGAVDFSWLLSLIHI